MSEPAPSGRRSRRKKATEAEVKTTAYIVLRAVELDESHRTALGLEDMATSRLWMPVLNQTAEEGPDGQPRVIQARDKAQAIASVTGPDGPDIVEGSFKAVALTAWRGGTTTRRTMKSDRLPLDEPL